MLKASESLLTYYPAYCFSASPTFNTWVKLTGLGFHALRSRRSFEGQGVYFYLNHPVQWVQITGLVVDFEPNGLYWLFHIDDGSGALVEVVLPRIPTEKMPMARPGEIIALTPSRTIGMSVMGNEVDVSQIKIGVIVKVKGSIREFRSVKQIALERLFYLKDTASELQAWESSILQYQAILSKPWTLSRSEELALKHRALGYDEEAKHRKDKRKMRERRRASSRADKKPAETGSHRLRERSSATSAQA